MKEPAYWKSKLSDIDDIVNKIQKGKVSKFSSTGGRPIYCIEYGKINDYKRTANYSSACGAGDIRCYADKTGEDIRPCVMFIGAIHGAEFEGTVALLNMINIIETGKDLNGIESNEFDFVEDNYNLMIIPCANPDGRARVPFSSPVGMDLDNYRYYAQGTWKNGKLCGWPECKTVHPMVPDKSGYLGAYYTDNGVNIMHDNFSNPMADETKYILDLVDRYVPDVTVLLHGGTNTKNQIIQPSNVPDIFKERAYRLSCMLEKACKEESLLTQINEPNFKSEVQAYNLTTAIINSCGQLCVTYETNEGLNYGNLRLGHYDIYRHHIILFKTALNFAKELIMENKMMPL